MMRLNDSDLSIKVPRSSPLLLVIKPIPLWGVILPEGGYVSVSVADIGVQKVNFGAKARFCEEVE